MTIRNKKTGAIYSSDTLIDDSRYGEYYDSAIQVNGEYGSVTLSFPSDEWEEVKETETEWHDLRTNPNDLPSDDREVLCYIKGERCNGYRVDYYIADMELGWAHLYDVIAWCEIPKFDEGKK